MAKNVPNNAWDDDFELIRKATEKIAGGWGPTEIKALDEFLGSDYIAKWLKSTDVRIYLTPQDKRILEMCLGPHGDAVIKAQKILRGLV